MKQENGIDKENYIVFDTKQENDVEQENSVYRDNVFVFWSLVFFLLGYEIFFSHLNSLSTLSTFCGHTFFFYLIFVGYSSLKMQIYDKRTHPALM